MARLGLQLRLLLVVLVCSLLIAGSIVWYSVINYQKTFYQAQQKKIESIIRTIDVQVNTLQDLKDGARFRDIFSYLMEYDNDLLQINLLAPINGNYYVLASNNSRKVGEKVWGGELEVLRTDKSILLERTPGKLLEIAAPIHVGSQPMAAMSFFLDISSQTQALQGQVTRMLLIGLVGTGVLMALLYLFLHRLLFKPLRELGVITTRLGQGDLSQRVDIKGDHELGQLARSFNLMADKLLQRYQHSILDGETGLPNYLFLKDRLEAEVSKGQGRPFALLCVDLGGCLAGFRGLNLDRGAKSIFGLLSREVRGKLADGDLCARYGGNQLMILARGLEVTEAVNLAEQIAAGVKEFCQNPKTTDYEEGLPFYPGEVYIGISLFPANSGEGSELAWQAEAALQEAKDAGLGPVRVFDLTAPLLGVCAKKALLENLKSLSKLVDGNSGGGYSHPEVVARYAGALAVVLGLQEAEIRSVTTAALLHDLGKIGLPTGQEEPETTLGVRSRGRVTEHPGLGALMVLKVPGMEEVARIILNHHEYYDGSGYPRGLAGEEIPLGARVLAVADEFYHLLLAVQGASPEGVDFALGRLAGMKGARLDPRIVDVFWELLTGLQVKITEVSA